MEVDATIATVAALGLLGTLVGSVISYRIARETAREETERLRVQERLEDRRVRRDIYHRMIATLQRIDALGVSFGSEEEYARVVHEEYTAHLAELRVSGGKKVIDSVEGVADVFREIGVETAARGQQPAHLPVFQAAYRRQRAAALAAREDLVNAMRRDLDPG